MIIPPLPRRRRNVVADSTPLGARCTDVARHTHSSGCWDVYCPRHEPTAYADHMAKHATDSF